jgi:hypothetical protein
MEIRTMILENRKYTGLTASMMWKYNESLEEVGKEKITNCETMEKGIIVVTDSAEQFENCERKSALPYAIFPKRIYSQVSSLPRGKLYNYNFIGGNFYEGSRKGKHCGTELGLAQQELGQRNRAWILNFIEERFNRNSYLEFTDAEAKGNHVELGEFDYTLKSERPKEYDYSDKGQKGYEEGGRGFDKHYYSKMKSSLFTLCPAGDHMYSIRFYEALMCESIPIVNSVDETFRSPAEEKLDYKYYLTTDDIKYRQDWADHNLDMFMRHHTFDNSGP